MKMRLPLLLAAIGMMMGSPLLAQPAPDLQRFRAFADPLIGRWTVSIRDVEEDGRVSWEGMQQRVFTYTVANEFLEERALVRSQADGHEVVLGLHLTSYDPARNRLIQQGFWPGTPGALFNLAATLSADNRRADGEMEMPRETGFRDRRRAEMLWQSADMFVYRLYARGRNGAEFLNEELIYRRLS